MNKFKFVINFNYSLKNKIVVILGAILLVMFGRNRFYHMAQRRNGIFGKIASGFCKGHAGRVGQNYGIFSDNKDLSRLSDIAKKYYSDDDLHGFGEYEYTLRGDNKTLLEQMRGQIIPLVEYQINTFNYKKVIEIGTSNGDVLSYLAEKYPEVEFIGIDLSVKNAVAKHDQKNLKFIKGYALDLFEKDNLVADLVFGVSTWCIFTPLELEAYFRSMKKINSVVIAEPVTFGTSHGYSKKCESLHMDLYMWWHNYYGYLLKNKFNIDEYKTINYKLSNNPNAKMCLISGHR